MIFPNSNSSCIETYKAKASCRIGGFFRRAGEVFSIPKLQDLPKHLEKVTIASTENKQAQDNSKPSTKTGGSKSALLAKEAQINKKDLGLGAPTPTSSVSSVDVISK